MVTAPKVAPSDQQLGNDIFNPGRRFAFYFTLALVFLRFSMLHEMVTFVFGRNLYLLYIVGPPALLGILATGGVRRTIRHPISYFWIAFLVWMLIDTPLSTWRGGSVDTAGGFARLQFPMLFVMAGMAVTWKDCRALMVTVALAAFASVAEGRLFTSLDTGGRLSLDFGTISNANDFAAHLILLLPFLLFVALSPGKLLIYRLASTGAIAYGLYLVLATASRGAEIGLGVAALFIFWNASMRARFAMLMLVPIAVVGLIVALPRSVLLRLQTFSSTPQYNGEGSEEAAESAAARSYLLSTSIKYTLQHPLFGVGPGQFSTYEGSNSKEVNGIRGTWQSTHNIFTQISSECGVPGLIFYVGATICTLITLKRVRDQARRHQLEEIGLAAFCVMLGLVGFIVAATFLNLAYLFYMPAIGGLAIAMQFATQAEIATRRPSPPSVPAVLPRKTPAPPSKQARRIGFGGYRQERPARHDSPSQPIRTI